MPPRPHLAHAPAPEERVQLDAFENAHGPSVHRARNQWSKTLADTGIALLETPEITALKGLTIEPDGQVRFLPTADGTFDDDLRDVDDFDQMNLRRVCYGAEWCD